MSTILIFLNLGDDFTFNLIYRLLLMIKNNYL